MARLSYDGLLLLARMPASETMTLVSIAINVFNGYDPENPTKPKAGAMARTIRAASNLIAMKRARGFPTNAKPQAIKSTDTSGGSVQAQALMNLVVRGGVDRRKADRRATPDQTDAERRAMDRRSHDTPTAPPRRIVRPYTKGTAKSAPRAPSPFDIPEHSKLAPEASKNMTAFTIKKDFKF